MRAAARTSGSARETPVMAKGGSAEKVYAKEVYAPRAPAPTLTVWKRAR